MTAAAGRGGITVAVTGASGCLGANLVRRLAADPMVARVVALDREAFPDPGPTVEYHACDVRDPEVGRFFEGCSSVVHLAFVVERASRQDRRAAATINMGGTRNVCEAAAAMGVPQIVYASSAVVYGMPSEPPGDALTEDAPLRPDPTFEYAQHKYENERWLDEFEAAHPAVHVARMRPAIFLSERHSRLLTGVVRAPFCFRVIGQSVPLQLSHEDDIADAFVLAVRTGARGAFNLAGEEPLTGREMARAMQKLSLPVPWTVLLALHTVAYRLRIVDVDPEWLRIWRLPLLVSSDKARRELGWRPRDATTAAALRRIARRTGGRLDP